MSVHRVELGLNDLFSRIFKQKELAEAAVEKHAIREEKRKTIFLIDVQGLYLGLITWMAKSEIPLSSGALIGNLAANLVEEAVSSVERLDAVEFAPGGVDYRSFVDWVVRQDCQKVTSTTKVNRWEFEVELFFAPSPLHRVQRRLQQELRKGRTKALSDLERNLEEGLVPIHGRLRNYRYYDDFVAVLKDHFDAIDVEKGFFNFSICRNGLRYFDEKEVDIRIAVRAMDITQGEADAICIVSSDQDFMPLHQRCRDGGLRTYHADLAKFDQHENIGRKIKELGEDLILVEMPKWMSGDILQKYTGSPQMIVLNDAEYKALWLLYEKVNGRPFGR